LEILNHLSYEISRSIAANSKLRNIVGHIRRILKLSRVSLWFADDGDQWLEKAASDEDSQSKLSGVQLENDVRLARWQMTNRRPVSTADNPLDAALLPALGFISLPLQYKGQIKGVLNFFWRTDRNHSFEFGQMRGSMEFLAGIANQLAIFIENRYLQKHTTFLKEIHHRVKNNLQNVASILRLQVRRLDGVSAEQALNDSISRIMSIALVHETLGQEEIGMVDLRGLLRNVGELALSGRLEPTIAMEILGTSVMIPSREATSLALVVNELVQNAVRHAYKGQSEGKLSIFLEHSARNVSVTVQDEGGGLPEHFNPEKDGNLGLTIVRTLVRDDLRGRFTLKGGMQTTARVVFPLPKNYYEPGP
jgi:two-component sensor histidine kinase